MRVTAVALGLAVVLLSHARIEHLEAAQAEEPVSSVSRS